MDVKSVWIRAGQIAAQNERHSEQVFDAVHKALDYVGHFVSIEKDGNSLACKSPEGDVALTLNAPASEVTIKGGDNKSATVDFRDAGYYDAVAKVIVGVKGVDKSFGQTFDRVIAEIEAARPAYILT